MKCFPSLWAVSSGKTCEENLQRQARNGLKEQGKSQIQVQIKVIQEHVVITSSLDIRVVNKNVPLVPAESVL